jgi:hypothetical protein
MWQLLVSLHPKQATVRGKYRFFFFFFSVIVWRGV